MPVFRRTLACFTALSFLIAACASGEQTGQITSEPLVSPTAAPTMTAPSPSPTPEATDDSSLSLTIWWPETLSPVGDVRVSAVLSEQLGGFEVANAGLEIVSRLKRPRDVGGIMETLRAANAVAPGALPDVTLLRRQDLVAAVQAGIVQPLEGHVSSAIVGNLYTAALELGQVNGQLFGLPYVLDVQHLAYWGDYPSGDFASFENVLTLKRAFTFPAGVNDGVNAVFLLQYLSAGGSLSDFSTGEVNADALQSTLQFYEQAVAAGVIDPAVLNYNSYNDYLTGLQNRTIRAGVVSSTAYLTFGSGGQALAFAPIPVQAGQPTTVLNGWMWVLTTSNADQQMLASRFLDWMLNTGRQSQYSQAIHMLPSLRASARQAGVNAIYADFVTQLMGNAVLPLPEISSSSTARILQNALVVVIGGQRTAEEATQDALSQLSD